MVTDNPLIESCFSRTPPRPEILGIWLEIGRGSAWLGWELTGAGWVLAGSWLGAGWKLAESNHYDEPRVPRASFDFSRRLGPAGGGLRTEYPGRGQSGEVARGVTLAGSEVLPIHRMLERSGGGILQLVLGTPNTSYARAEGGILRLGREALPIHRMGVIVTVSR